MAVLVNPETGQAFEVADDEAEGAARSMGLTQATPAQIDWLRKQREYEAKPFAERAAETGEAAVVGLMKSGRELGKLRLDDSGAASALFPEQAPQVAGAIKQHQQERDAILADPRTAEISERHPLAHAIGVDAPALFISPAVGGLGGMALESVGVGALEEAVGSTDEGRDFDLGNAAELAAQDLAFSGLAHAATQVASRVGGLLMFGTGNTMSKNVKRGIDGSSGPIVPDDVRFDAPLLEAETRSRRTAAAASPGMPPGPERDEMLRRAAADLNEQVKNEGGDLIDSTFATAKTSASAADDAVSRRIDDFLPNTTPAQTSWSADATRKLDETRAALTNTTDEAAAPFVSRAQQIADEMVTAIDGSGDASTWFKASSVAREKLDALADDIAGSELPATHRAGLIVDDARGFLQRSLTDRALFGNAAEMHSGIYGAARDKIGAAAKTAEGDLRARLAEFVSADEATRAALRGPLEQAVDGFEELAKAHEQFGTAPTSTIEALRENAAKMRRGLKLADDVQSAQRSAPKAAPRPARAAEPSEPDFSRADALTDQIRKRAGGIGVQAAQKVVDYAAGPGRAVYDDAVSDVIKGTIQSVAAIGGLAAFGPPGMVAGWLGARSIGKKIAPKMGQQILDAAQRYVKQHGADTAGMALLGAAALGEGDEEGDSGALAASVGGLFFARRFAERALGVAGRGVKAAGKGVMKASEAAAGAVDSATGKAVDAFGRANLKAGRAVGGAIGSGVDAVAKVASDEDLMKSAIKSGVRDPKRWLVRNTRGRIADKAAEYFGPRISGAATKWLEKRHGKTAQEVVNDAVGETVEAARKDGALLEQHSAQSAAMVEDVGAQIRNALNETAEQKARALQAFPQRIGGDAHAQRELLTSAVDELSVALGKVSDGTTAKVAVEFANAAKEAIINARTAKDRFRIGMQLTETLVHHTAEAGDSEMSKVFGAYADKMWEAMGQREVWMGARELQREAKRVAKKRESIISKISAGEKLGIAALAGSAAVDDDESGAAMASAGLLAALTGKIAPKAFADAARKVSGATPIAKALSTYTDDMAYRSINRVAREGTDSFADDLIGGMNNPRVRGHDAAGNVERKAMRIQNALMQAREADLNVPGLAYRTLFLTKDELANLQKAKTASAQGFMSTTTSHDYAHKFAKDKLGLGGDGFDRGKIPVVIEVAQQSGIPIAGRENELLLPAGLMFDVERNGDRIRLTERADVSPRDPSDMGADFSQRPTSMADNADAWVAGGLLALGAGGAALSYSGDASAAEPEDDRTVAANRILAIDNAATQRIRHTARVLAGLAEPPDPEGLTTALHRFGADYDDPRAAFEDRKAILQKSEISPALVYDVIGSSLGDVASVSPELYQAAAARLLDNFRYLRENLPPEVKSSMVYPTGMPPSESAMRDWATQWSTVMDPESVLDDIEHGTVTHLQIQTLQESHPDSYERLRTEILAEVGANFQNIPTSTKMQLDLLFQADGLAGPMFSSEAAAIIGAADAAAMKRKQPGPPESGATDDVGASSSGLEAIRSSVTNRGA